MRTKKNVKGQSKSGTNTVRNLIANRNSSRNLNRNSSLWLLPAALLTLATPFATVLAQAPTKPAAKLPFELEADRIPAIKTTGSCLLKGGTVITAGQADQVSTDVLIVGGKIKQIGKGISVPADVPVIDCTGRFVTPGIIDAHSHIGVDGINEGSDSITAEVRMKDVIDPDQISWYRQLSSGVTSALVLHGSANAIGGQSVVVKLKYKHPVEDIVVADAPRMIKFALGENVKQSNRGGFNGPTRFPSTRMGVEAVYRRGFEAAKTYVAEWDAYSKERLTNPFATPPRKDIRLETLADILRGAIRVQCHGYRADELAMMVRLSQEYHFSLVLQHALEAYKITPEIKAAGVGVSTFADAWAYKVEANDAIPFNAALCLNAGIITSVNSDNPAGTDRLNIEAANCMKFGGVTADEALRLITINPAIQLGIAHRTGSLEAGKDGDVVVWSGHPLSVYSKCDLTIIEGETLYQRRDAFKLDSLSVLAKALPGAALSPALPMYKTGGADTVTPPVLADAAAYAIVGATIHPVAGADIPEGTVVIADGKIVAAGKSVKIPAGALKVAGKGLHVYPGLIDAGSGIGLMEIESVAATIDASESGEFQPDLLASSAVNPGSEHWAIARNNGITTAAVTPSGGTVSGQIGILNLAGWTPKLMQIKQAYALRVNFPEARVSARFAAFLPPDQLQQIKDRDTQRVKLLKDYFEKAKRYAAARAARATAFDPQLEAMVPYASGKSPIVFNVSSRAGVKQAIQFAEDNGLKAILSGGSDAWKEAELLATKHIPYLLSIPVNNSIAEVSPTEDYDPVDTVWSAAAILKRAGVKLAFQTGSASEVKNLPRQVGIMCAYGLSQADALKALTLDAAEVLGVQDQVGSISAGKIANILVTDGDPLEACTHIKHLFISGKPIRLESRHTQLYDLYRQRLKDIR